VVFSSCQTILCVLLLLSPVVSGRSQSAVDKTTTSTISGKVTVGGKGQSGVVVGLVVSELNRPNIRPTRFRSTTDEIGNYRITNVPPGTYDVIAASPAFVPTEGRKSLLVGKNETVENIDITLERGGVITGKVTDADGSPVIEEMVYLTAATTARPVYIRNIRTDDRGVYRAYGIPPGSYKVSAGRDARSSLGSRRSDGEHQRTYHPSAVDPAAATVIDVSDGSEATNVDITFGRQSPTYSARGRIIDNDTAQALPNAQVGVKMFLQNGSSSSSSVAESTKDGEFKVENLVPGKYEVYAQPSADSDWHSKGVQIEVIDRDIEGLLITTSRGASVSGVVVLEGTDDLKMRAKLLTSRLLVQIVDGYLGRPSPFANINQDGSFRISGLPAGRLMLHLQSREQTREPFRLIRLERDGIPYPRGVEITEREQVTGLRVVVVQANGAIRGVIRVPTGLALPAAARLRVIFRRTEDPGSYVAPVEADARGHFRAEGLIPGTYEIAVIVSIDTPSAQRPRIPPTRQTVVVTSGAAADVTITLEMPKPAISGP
jgi:hypothetical protein